VNLGYVALALRTGDNVGTGRQAIEIVSDKIGLVFLVLGGMHFLNLYVFSRLRRRNQEPYQAPPLSPDLRVPMEN